METFSFGCSACGRCCNSPPVLTLDELFHHAGRFVGCLAVRRGDDGAIVLQAQGHDYPSLSSCPALDDAGRCGIRHDRKPGMCRVVPLEPREPASRQVVVLRRRHVEAAFLEADCLAPAPRAGFEPLVEGGRIVDPDYAQAFEQYRTALREDDDRWGRDVHAWLRPELARMGTLPPPDGYLALSLLPVLAVLSRDSAAARDHCVGFAQRQVGLIEDNVARAIRRRHAPDRPFTEELRRFASQYARFCA